MLKKTICFFAAVMAIGAWQGSAFSANISSQTVPTGRQLNFDNVSLTDSLDTPDFLEYGAELQNQINSNWYPKSLKNKRSATVLLTLNADGSIKEIKIQKSSNKKKFDAEIYSAIYRALPFDAMPSNLVKDYKAVQINFIFDKDSIQNHMVLANIKNMQGYDDYISQVEKAIKSKISGRYKQYFCKKDVVFEISMNKAGNVRYVKVKNFNPNDGFIKNEFNKKMIANISSITMPPIPDVMKVDEITIDYRVLTQRQRKFKNFLSDYLGNFFRTDIESYAIQNPDSL